MKKLVATLHLWIGLASGLVVFVVAITGAIWVFSDEITALLRADATYVEPRAEKTVALDELWQKIQSDTGTKDELWRINVFSAADRSWVFFGRKNSPEAITYLGLVDYYDGFYVDPYSGQLLAIYDEEHDFFNVVKLLHYSLLLNFPYGKPIVGICTIIVIIMLISGIYLWWPKTKQLRRQKFLFQWNTGTSLNRKYLDVHNILGFYISSIVLLIALTGLVFAFAWFRDLVYMAGAGTTTPQVITRVESVVGESDVEFPLDRALHHARSLHPTAELIIFSMPVNARGAIGVRVQQEEYARYVAHNLQFDQYSGKLLSSQNHTDRNLGEKLIAANYDLHIGLFFGMPGKILAFVASLFCASLPVTGFMVWWGRRSTKKRLLPAATAERARALTGSRSGHMSSR